jgi:uncharacterized protein (DUF1684 family)
MKRFVAIALSLAVLAACKPKEAPPAQAPAPAPAPSAAAPAMTHEQEIRDWQTRRAERLKSPDGWLSLVGLFWLQEGENRFGSDRARNRVIFPAKAPADAGTLTMRDGHVTLTARAPMTIDGKPVAAPTPLVDDSDPKGPTIVELGTSRFQVIKRGPRYGVRIKDPEAETRTKFLGLEYFPIDPKWRVEAKFEPYNPPKKIPITDVTGMTSDSISPGALAFTLDGQTYRIDPILEEGSDELFIIVKDATSHDTTYQAGRYMYAKKPGPDGKVIVDFNKLYNPPCAFTDFATCPLPPKQNIFPIRIEAGEKRYAGSHHH